jgi:glutathione peroxidase
MRPIGRFLVVTAALLFATAAAPGRADAQGGSAHDFMFESIDGGQLPLAELKGRVGLIVNTASFCGFTHQYAGLQELWTRYEARGLVVVGVPANDFGGQEPGTDSDIKTFCQGGFGITFPLAAKSRVVGPLAHPFYRWAAKTLGPANVPRWNFHKYLVGVDGGLVAAFGSSVGPTSVALVSAIEAELAKAAPKVAP